MKGRRAGESLRRLKQPETYTENMTRNFAMDVKCKSELFFMEPCRDEEEKGYHMWWYGESMITMRTEAEE